MQANRNHEGPLKILMLESSPNWGGQEDRLLREARWMQEHGHKVLLACGDSAAIIGRAGAAGVEARAIPFRSPLDIVGIRSLARLIRKERPDVMHARSSKDAWFSFWFHRTGLPVVRSRHTTLPQSMRSGRRFIYRHGCRRLIASAGFIADTMRDALGIPGDRIDVIGECVDTTEFSPGDGSAFRREFGIPDEAPLFGIVAMMRGEKGHDTFLSAARLVLAQRPDARFVIVGGSTSENPVETFVRETVAGEFDRLPGKPVILTGFRRDIPRIMRALTCLAVPSRFEAQTLVIPQAFATGKPVIGSRVGGIPEVMRDGASGFLIEPDNPAQLADRMLRIAGEPELARQFGRAGRDFAESRLEVNIKMQELLACYRKAVAPAKAV